MLALLHCGKTITSRSFGVICIQPSVEVLGEVYIPPPASVPLALSKFLAEHNTSQFRLLILVTPCWIEAPCLPTVLNMLVDK